MLAEGLVVLLAADSGVQAIVGTKASRTDGTTGIFPVDMPEATPLPAVVFFGIHDEGEMTFDGPDPFTMSRIQFSCHGAAYADAKHLARAVRLALENFSGQLNEGTQVDSMHRISEIDSFADAPFSYMTAVDFAIGFRDLGS